MKDESNRKTQFLAKLGAIIKSLKNSSKELDRISLRLASLGENREIRGFFLDAFHLDHPLAYAIWMRKGIPREKRIDPIAKACNLDEFIKLNKEDDEKQGIIDIFRCKLQPKQEEGHKRAKEMFESVLLGTYRPSNFKDYYWMITYPQSIKIVFLGSKSNPAVKIWELINQQYIIEKRRASVLAHFEFVCLGILNLPWIILNEQHIKLIRRAREISEKLDRIVDSLIPDFSKDQKDFIHPTPFDTDMVTKKGLDKLGSFKSTTYHKRCEGEGCKEIILRTDFAANDKKSKGPKNKYCESCRNKQREKKTRERVQKYRTKNTYMDNKRKP